MTQLPEIGLGHAFKIVRWLTIPLMSTAGVLRLLTDDSFRWHQGPYGALFGSWLIGYMIWAGQTTMANACSTHQFSISSGRKQIREEVSASIDSYRWKKGAKIEVAVAIITLVAASILPEKGFAIVALTIVHMVYVIAWRTSCGRGTQEVAT